MHTNYTNLADRRRVDKAPRFNGVVHFRSDIHAGVSIEPVGRHDYEAFQSASQFPDGLIRIANGTAWRWDLGRNQWSEVAA